LTKSGHFSDSRRRRDPFVTASIFPFKERFPIWLGGHFDVTNFGDNCGVSLSYFAIRALGGFVGKLRYLQNSFFA
jgi:hypothetical protein